jgi:hypothetical protein
MTNRQSNHPTLHLHLVKPKIPVKKGNLEVMPRNRTFNDAGQKSASRKFRHIGNDKRARDLQSERTQRGRKDDAIATLRVSEIAIWRQLISRRDTFSFSGPLT